MPSKRAPGGSEGVGTPSDRTLNPGKGGAWRCVSLGSVYVAARVGAVCLLACVIACGLCEVPGGGQLRLALGGQQAESPDHRARIMRK